MMPDVWNVAESLKVEYRPANRQSNTQSKSNKKRDREATLQQGDKRVMSQGQGSKKRDRFSVALYATEERSPELWSNGTS